MPSFLHKAVSQTQHRDAGVDQARGFAVFLMVLCHAIRSVQPVGRPEWTRWVMAVEPLAQVLFLFLLGASLALSMPLSEEGRLRQWSGKHLRRGGALVLLSAGMVLLERGEWQGWVNVLGGFLGLAGKSLILLVGMASVPERARRVFMIWMGILLWGTSGGLEIADVRINGLNAGNGPFLPLAAVAWTGWVWVRFSLSRGWKGVLSGLVLLLGGFLLLGPALRPEWWEQGGRCSVAVDFYRQGHVLQVFYYTLSVPLALFWTGFSIVLIVGLRHGGMILQRILTPPGRHSLLVYCVHLGVLGLVRVSWGRLDVQFTGWLCLGMLILMWLLAEGATRFKRCRL